MKEQMKSFTHLTKPFVLFVLLITVGVGNAWGDPAEGDNWYDASNAHVYFDNTNSNYDNVSLLIGRKTKYNDLGDNGNAGSDGENMTLIENTNNLYYRSVIFQKYTTMCFIKATNWGWGGEIVTTRMGYVTSTTTSNDNLGSGTHLYVPASDQNNCAVTHTTPSDYDGLNYTQTVQQTLTTDGGSTYEASTLSLATVKVSSYYLSAAGTASATGDKVIAAGQSSNSCKAARTATVTYTVSDVTDGYDFLGWFDGSTKKSIETTYDYQATEAKTITARFAPKFTTGKTLYLVTNSDWRGYSARFAAVFCNRTSQQWEDCSVVDGTSNEIYSVDVPEGDWSFVIFCRMKPGSENRWNTNEDTEDTKPVWCQTKDMVAYGYYNSVYITGSCSNEQRWGKYAPALAIVGDMNNWDPITTNTFTDNVLVLNTLAAHSGYNFKIANGKDDTWYGFGDADNKLAYVGQTSAVTLGSNNHNILLLTAGTGNYTFTWDASAHTLTVAYPTVTHPSVDYVYVKKFADWDPVEVHLTGGTKSTVSGAGPNLSSFEFNDVNYYYAAYGDNTTVVFGDGPDGPLAGHKTADLTISGNEGKFYDASGSYEDWKWLTFQVSVGLNDLTEDTHVDPNFFWAQLNSTDLSSDAEITTLPAKTHYDFQGFYTQYAAGVVSGEQVIDDEGNWIASVPDYTDEDTKWIHAGTSTTLYAKWTETPRTITLQVSPEGAGSFLVGGVAKAHGDEINAYISTATPTITATPSHAAWKFARWEYGTGVGNKAGTGGDNTVQITSDRDGTLTAVFEPRFCLVGDKYDGSSNGGMPGWASSVYDDSDAFFTVNSTSPSVNLTCTCTLDANTRYRFQVHDRAQVKNLGAGTNNEYALLDGDYVDMTVQDMNVTFTTTGEQRYIFHIYGILENDRPRLEILWPRKVNFGWKYADADAMSTLNEGGGGTVTAYVHEGATKTSISNNGWMMNGDSISFTAHPYNDYQLAGWWNDYGFSNKTNMNGDSVHWTVTTENAQLYAKFVEKTDTLKSGTTWSGGTWSMGSQPTADIVAVIKSHVEVDITDAKAKKVLLRQDGGNTGKIEIPAGKELVVRTTIKKTTDGSNYGATGYEDIVIGSSLAEGNGALVMNTNDGTNKATVNFAVKAKKVDGHNVNQFIGTPFNDETNVLYNYYGTKIYRFMAAHNGQYGTEHEWNRVAETNDKMEGFYGYNILTNQTTEPVLWMQGTLNRSAEETITGYYNGSSNTENMFANSWVAPIYIPNFENDDFTNIEKTIYIFNAGTPVDQGNHTMGEGTQTTTAAGQYCVVPVKAAEYTGLKVIPAMQAFSVLANGASPSIKFNYTRLVYNPSNGTATIVPTRAPRRTATNDPDAPTVLRLAVTGESGYAAKIVLLERTDFSDNFDDGWDGRFLPGDDAAPQLYAVTEDGNMAINCSPDIEGTLLGFKAGEADNLFTFTFEYDDEALYLYDTQTQLYTRVQTGSSYTFTTADGDAHNRFILTRKAPSITTGMEASNIPSPGANKVIIDNHLYIFRAGMLYDALGRIIQ